MRLIWCAIVALGIGLPVAAASQQEQESPPATPTDTAQPESAVHNAPKTEGKSEAPANSPSTTGVNKTGNTVPVSRRHRVAHKHSSPPVDKPQKVVVREGGAPEPSAQIVTGMTPAEAARERQNAEQSLNSTDQTLKGLGERSLDGQQQETVSQIHNYMHGAQAALKEGDISRAQMLAAKASMLAEDLAKH